MCVIIIKPANAAMPSIEELRAAYECNPHGCGFVSETKFYKSLSFERFLEELSEVREDERCIIHFRLATHGSVRRANCHPFKYNNVYFAHNGILKVDAMDDRTDSETAFRNILMPIIESRGLESPELEYTITQFIGSSKFAFMYEGKIYTFGQFIKHKGRYYSNTRHINVSPRYKEMTWGDYLALR